MRNATDVCATAGCGHRRDEHEPGYTSGAQCRRTVDVAGEEPRERGSSFVDDCLNFTEPDVRVEAFARAIHENVYAPGSRWDLASRRTKDYIRHQTQIVLGLVADDPDYALIMGGDE